MSVRKYWFTGQRWKALRASFQVKSRSHKTWQSASLTPLGRAGIHPKERHHLSKTIWGPRYFLGPFHSANSRLFLILSNPFLQPFGSLQRNMNSSEMSIKFDI